MRWLYVTVAPAGLFTAGARFEQGHHALAAIDVVLAVVLLSIAIDEFRKAA